ncbi:MAG TPA: hypothetical protein VHV30_01015 [Polyangiaceae bacterium]|jgi:hypothetical protein|nr:hypothetical protein [Polyangiaceae bacterium]
MRPLRAALSDALAAQDDVDGFACVDVRAGAVIEASARDRRVREALDLAARAAAQICAAPRLESPEEDDARARGALVVSDTAVHAFARSRRSPGRVVVGIGRGHVNVGLLLASVHAIADGLPEETS